MSEPATTSLVPAGQAGLTLLAAGLTFHIRHLEAKNHAEHVVLGNVYNDAITMGDELLEQLIGVEPTILETVRYQVPVSVEGASDAALAALVHALESAALQTTDSAVQNKLQEYVAAFRRHQFLLELARKE